jgi:sigma-B regulation protein RsbU (phosphoserine phosphatase)
MKVLVAEDDPIAAEVLRMHLESWGHEVVMTENGAEAWRRFERDHVALVISDWMMPELDGLELVRRIRLCDRGSYAYVILLTARSRKEDIVRGMEAGADDFLGKPFDRDELRVRLRAGERILQLEQSLARRNEELERANVQITEANRHMKRNLEAAAAVQRALLPVALPDSGGVRFAWTFRPCEELGGDMFGVVPVDERHTALYALDVSGHGVAAALLSVSVRHALSSPSASGSLLRQPVPEPPGHRLVPPAEVAAELNRRFPMDSKTSQYFTLIYGLLDRQTHSFRYISAGHPGLAYLPRGEDATILLAPGLPIGIDRDVDYEERVLPLGPDDRLYLYSDGIPEAFGPDDKAFGVRRLLDTLDRGRAAPLAGSLAGLVSAVEAWCAPAAPRDDVSVLAVEVAKDCPDQ